MKPFSVIDFANLAGKCGIDNVGSTKHANDEEKDILDSNKTVEKHN